MWQKFLFLVSCSSLARLVQAVNPDSAESKIAEASRIEKLPVGRDKTGKVHWPSSRERQDEESTLVLTPEQCSELADKHGSLRESKKDWKATAQDPTEELHSSGGLCAPVGQQIGISNIGCTLAGSLYGMVDTEFFAEWDPMRELYEPAPPHEWNSEEETNKESALSSTSEQSKEDSSLEQVSGDSSLEQVNNDKSLEQVDEDSYLEQVSEDQEAAASEESAEGNVQEIVKFRRFQTPEDFVEHCSGQERLFQGLSHPFSPEQKRELKITYYRFANARKLLKELGKKAFLKKYGKSTVAKMLRDVAAEIKQREAAEEGQMLQV